MKTLRKPLSILVALLSVTSFLACTEKIDTSARYVFTENTAYSYLEKHVDTYSEYLRLLGQVPVSRISRTTLAQLLSARGHYTVFAPTNQAVQAYLDTLVADGLIASPAWEAFTDSVKLDSIRKVIVYNSIIDSGDNDEAFETGGFPLNNGGEFMLPTMNDRKITVYYEEGTGSMLLYNRYRINDRNQDIRVLNGVVHQVEGVIAPRNNTAAEYLQDLIDKGEEGYLVMARAIVACGLKDTLRAIRDDVYEQMYEEGKIADMGNTYGVFEDNLSAYAPRHRKYGFTIFAETDDFWRSQGIDPHDPQLLTQLVQWIQDQHQYSDEDQFTAEAPYDRPQSLLYQWVTYHMLPMKIPSDKLTFHTNELGYTANLRGAPTIPVYELYTTMGQRRLLKVYQSAESDGIYLNRFPTLDNGRRGTYHELSCDPDKTGARIGREDPRAELSAIVNCNIYPIDAPLSYNDEVRNNLMKQRMRYDAQSLFPELMNNDIRLNASKEARNKYLYMPPDNIYRYLDNMWSQDGTYVICFNYGNGNPSMNEDEIKAGGLYDVTIKLPPVPRKGTYEFRYAILNMPYRGVCQTYFSRDRDNRVVTGIPTDMTKSVWNAETGFEQDTEDQDYNAEVDKRMRSLGYMKGCMSYATQGNGAYAHRLNTTHSCMRQLVTRQFLDPNETYYISFKNVLDFSKELYLDYFEWCAKEVYDNPVDAEDIW